MRRVVISDVRSYVRAGVFRGHGRAVAEHFLKVFRGACDCRVAGGPAYSEHFQDIIPLPYNTVGEQGFVRSKWRVLSNLRTLFRSCRHDAVILQSCAVVTAFIGIALFKKPETKLFMIQYDKEGVRSGLKRFLFRLAKGKIDGIICPHEDIGRAYGLPYCVVPDYIYTEDAAPSAALPYAEKPYDFCMLGQIWRSKGILEAARHLAGKPYKVLVAGMPSEEQGLREELEQLDKEADNIEMHLRYLSPEEYEHYLSASRYCILNYSGCYSERSSGVVLDFLFHGVPVIGSHCRALQFIEENGLGKTVERMEDFQPSEVLQEPVHQAYISALQTYYAKHREYREKLIRFIEEA